MITTPIEYSIPDKNDKKLVVCISKPQEEYFVTYPTSWVKIGQTYVVVEENKYLYWLETLDGKPFSRAFKEHFVSLRDYSLNQLTNE
jgi:hypothetical protein